jgi:predicted molibdopterin-dependent oxidoreductase YjgC
VSWRQRVKPQPPNAKFKIPPVDAPNVTGARDLGFPVTATAAGEADLNAFRVDVQSGKVATLYVFDPGPAGSIGDLSWIVEARKAGLIKTLIVQGVLMTDLAKAADIVLAGAAWVEKDATYVNGAGQLQAASAVITPPGQAQEDWQVFVNVGQALGAEVSYASGAAIRAELAEAMGSNPVYASLSATTFARPVAAAHWLQASNPSERWKWDLMFQDLPPVKFAATPRASEPVRLAIPLHKVD